MTGQTRRYRIRGTDLANDKDVVFTVVDWTDILAGHLRPVAACHV